MMKKRFQVALRKIGNTHRLWHGKKDNEMLAKLHFQLIYRLNNKTNNNNNTRKLHIDKVHK